MLPAARIILPLSVTVVLLICKYLNSGRKSEFSGGVEVPLNPSDPSPALSDGNLNFLEASKFPSDQPSVPSPDAIQNRYDSIADDIRKLTLKEKENEKRRESEKSKSSSGSGSGGGNENGGGVEKNLVEESRRRNQYPLRPEAGDSSYCLKTGNCKSGSNCKFNHPRRRKNKQVSKDKAKQREELEEKTESEYYISPGLRIGAPSVAPALELNFLDLPIRPCEKDCSYYMRTLTCKRGTNCKFNHPDPTTAGGSGPQSAYGNGRPASLQGLAKSQGNNSETTEWNGYQVSKDKAKQREELEEKQDKTESKCEKDCSYYMRTLTCKRGTNCKFNHPDPTTAGDSRPQSAYGNGRPASSQGLPKSQGINSKTTEWNGCQAPAYLPPRSMPAPPPPPYVMNNAVTETKYYRQYAQQKQAEEFPERPGQYHHPKNHTAATPSCILNDRGLPLRPGQNICTEYSRDGLCSSGPTCRFDHPSLSGSFLLLGNSKWGTDIWK